MAGCVVRVTGPDPRRQTLASRPFYTYKNGTASFTVSGVLLGTDPLVCLTTGEVLAVFTDATGSLLPGVELSILCDPVDNTASDDWSWIPASLLSWLDPSPTALALERLVCEDRGAWRVGWGPVPNLVPGPSSATRRSLDADLAWVTRVAVLCLHPDPAAVLPAIAPVKIASPLPPLGSPISVVASPYALLSPMSFMNSVSRGAVSNILPQGQLVLIDARVLPGAEGAGVWTVAKPPCLLGLVTPILRRHNTPIALRAVIPYATLLPLLLPILRGVVTAASLPALGQVCIGDMSPLSDVLAAAPPLPLPGIDVLPARSANTQADIVAAASQSLVAVRIGQLWGSGVLVSSSGHILTCAHLVRPGLAHLAVLEGLSSERLPVYASSSPVFVRLPTDATTWYTATILFVAASLDVALLRVADDLVLPPRCVARIPDSLDVKVGDRVISLGYGAFEPRRGQLYPVTPSVSVGILCRIVPASGSVISMTGQPGMLQTDAVIHQGCSGGMLISATAPYRFLGLVTSLTRHTHGAVMPRLNFNIPAPVLSPLIRFAVSDNVDDVRHLLRQDAREAAMWRLQHPVAPKDRPFSRALRLLQHVRSRL